MKLVVVALHFFFGCSSGSGGSSTSQFNTGRWTDAEHQRFLRGLEEHGRGNWDAISTVVRTRSPQQVEAYATQYFAQSAEQLEVRRSGGGGTLRVSLAASTWTLQQQVGMSTESTTGEANRPQL